MAAIKVSMLRLYVRSVSYSMDGAITKSQRQGFLAAWLGWAFDGLDGYLYVLVATKFVGQLLGPGATTADIAQKSALIQGIFLVGWACGGILFGRIGDKLGRARTMSLTILTYAMFTGLTFFAKEWWHLIIFRFVAALGIGGEWAAGSALVSETMHPKHRAWASALLQSGYMVGMILAALTIEGLKNSEPRYVFLIGVLPALATFWIRKSVKEPEVWQNELETKKMPSILDLFAPAVRRTTLLTLGLTSIALTTVWAYLYFGPQLIRSLVTSDPTVTGKVFMEKPAIEQLIRSTVIIYSLWNIVGNFFGTYLAKFAGVRVAFVILLAGSFISYYFGFAVPHSLEETRLWLSIAAFFSLGLFGIFPLYIPPLFPVLLRTTGAGFSYNFGRVISGAAVIWLGMSTAKISPGAAIYYVNFLYLAGVLLAFFIPQMHKHPEQEAAAT